MARRRIIKLGDRRSYNVYEARCSEFKQTKLQEDNNNVDSWSFMLISHIFNRICEIAALEFWQVVLIVIRWRHKAGFQKDPLHNHC